MRRVRYRSIEQIVALGFWDIKNRLPAADVRTGQ